VVTARDSIGFARYALALDRRAWAEVLREEAHPPGYPLLVLAAYKAIGAGEPVTDRVLLAAQAASSVTGVLVVLPTFWLGRRLFGRGLGFWAALLLQLLPVFARDTADGLSDGPFLFGILTAIAIGTWALDRRRRWPGLLVCGLLSGLAYLIRPEGVLVPAALGVTLLLRAVDTGFVRAIGGAVAVAVGFVAMGGPYMATIGGFTNKPAFRSEFADATPAGGPLFAEALPPDVTGGGRLMMAVAMTGKEWMKAGHYGIAVLSVIGLVMTARRVWKEPKFWLPALFALGQLIAVVALGYRKGYISERHLLPVVAVGVLFAVGGLPAWFRLWAKLPAVGPLFAWKWWPALTCVGLAVAGAVPVLKTRLHEDRLGHKLAGAKLKEAVDALPQEQKGGVVVLDHYQWCQFFSGRAVTAIPPDPPEANQRVVFAVLEGKWQVEDGVGRWVPEKPDFGSDRQQKAVAYFVHPPGGVPVEWVYHHPEGPKENARMVLVKVTLPPR
jgi:4-amino-4-deoxy-L-arabinose transferase-like glycosyltransferase